jgi:GT2 family glycosyltransferase
MKCCFVIPYVNISESLKATIADILENDDNTVVAVRDTPRPEAGTDAAAAQLKHAAAGNLHLISDGLAKGYTRAINMGVEWAISHCTPELLCLLNDDVLMIDGRVPVPRKIPADAGLVGLVSNRAGYQSLRYGFDENGDFLYPEVDIAQANGTYGDLVERVGRRFLHVPLVHGFGFYIRPETFRALGGLDETGFPLGYGSDFDLSLRAEAAGLRNYVWTGGFVWHIGASTAGREQRHVRSVAADFVLKNKYGETYKAAKFKTRVRMNNHTGNFLEFA